MLELKVNVTLDSDGQGVQFRDITGTTAPNSYGDSGNITYGDVDAVVIEVANYTSFNAQTKITSGDAFKQYHVYIKTAGSSSVIDGKTFTVGEEFCPQLDSFTVPVGDTWKYTGLYRPQVLATWLPTATEVALSLDVSELGQFGDVVAQEPYQFNYSVFEGLFTTTTAAVSGRTYLVVSGTAAYNGDTYRAGETFQAVGTTNIVPASTSSVAYMNATSSTYFTLAYTLQQSLLTAIQAQVTAFNPKTQNVLYQIRVQLDAMENASATGNVSFNYDYELLEKLQAQVTYVLDNNT